MVRKLLGVGIGVGVFCFIKYSPDWMLCVQIEEIIELAVLAILGLMLTHK